jgi:subtilase family serine protease
MYNVKGAVHIANASDPKVPAALAPVVAGFNSLHDFKPKPAMRKPKPSFTFKCAGCPDGFDGQNVYFVSPSDFQTIYNVAPLYKAPLRITGKDQTVVVLEESNIKPSDVARFRHSFGLDAYSGGFVQIHPGPGCGNPGRNSLEAEAALDAEWAGAAAPDATVALASCADTATNFGPFIAAQNLLDDDNPPPVMSLSYISCEANLGPSGNLFILSLWEQAAVEGVSVFVAAGDSGAAACDYFDVASPNWAVVGIQANGLASTPFNIAAGGTDFLDTFEGSNAAYWSKANSSTGKSAKSYVPETTWNESCASLLLNEFLGLGDPISSCNSETGGGFLDIIAGGGAPSITWAKPYWQKNVYGIPNDGARDLPDISLFSSSGFWLHALLFCMSDTAQGGAPCDYSNPLDAFSNSSGGTSFSAPGLASIQALINQKAGGAQGNPASIYYTFARLQYGTSSLPNKAGLSVCNASLGNASSPLCLFHDVTVGNNAVPCYGTNNCYGGTGLQYGVLSTSETALQPAYGTRPGWDFGTGLGSLNVANIIQLWP